MKINKWAGRNGMERSAHLLYCAVLSVLGIILLFSMYYEGQYPESGISEAGSYLESRVCVCGNVFHVFSGSRHCGFFLREGGYEIRAVFFGNGSCEGVLEKDYACVKGRVSFYNSLLEIVAEDWTDAC